MVHSIARMRFGKVSNRVFTPADLLNEQQAGMMHSLRCGVSSECWTTEYTIKMKHLRCIHGIDLYQECD